jgi:hypothetical protein
MCGNIAIAIFKRDQFFILLQPPAGFTTAAGVNSFLLLHLIFFIVHFIAGYRCNKPGNQYSY